VSVATEAITKDVVIMSLVKGRVPSLSCLPETEQGKMALRLSKLPITILTVLFISFRIEFLQLKRQEKDLR